MTPGRTAAAALLVLAVGCSGGTPARSERTVTVFAASSLQQAFTTAAKGYEAGHAGVKVVLSFAGSQSLVAQVRQGAPADVLATADPAALEQVRDRLRGAPVVFAHNQLALVTARGNPLGLRTLQDLARPGLRVVLAGPTVPVGKAAAGALAKAGVTVRPVSLEDAASGVVTKVRLGEADAGIAYVTDLRGAGLGGVAVPGSRTALAIATLTGGAAAGFVAYVRSPAGQQVLQSYGFQ